TGPGSSQSLGVVLQYRSEVRFSRRHRIGTLAVMRACTKCGETKALDEFPPVRRGEEKRQSWCRDCFAAAGAGYYRRNRDREKARLLRQVAERRTEIRRLLIEYLRSHPCVAGGETDIVVLQFGHPGEK